MLTWDTYIRTTFITPERGDPGDRSDGEEGAFLTSTDNSYCVQQLAYRSDEFILVYDVTNLASFDVLPGMFEATAPSLRHEASGSPRGKPFCVMAHKVDLPEAEWQVNENEGRRWAEEIGAKFIKASAWTVLGLQDMTVEIVDKIVLNKIVEQKERSDVAGAAGTFEFLGPGRKQQGYPVLR